ncbi:MAG: hypothetical protein M1482_00940 [Chloroflexi bacterium]|nr:hypothetical protein [Chloroflexota bacterium]
MRERVESLNGNMQVWSAPHQGTRLTFHLPAACAELRDV